MSTAYYSGNPSFSSVDLIRFKTGDTGEGTAFILTDEEIQYFCTLYGTDINRIMVNCLEGLIAKLSHHPNFTLGDWSENRGDMIDKFTAMLKKYSVLSQSGGMSSGTAGPLTLNWKNEVEGDWDAVRTE